MAWAELAQAETVPKLGPLAPTSIETVPEAMFGSIIGTKKGETFVVGDTPYDAQAAAHLLEPVHKLVLVTPASSTSRVSSAVASRRGQMLGMGPRDGWTGWDRIEALIPESELDGLEAELRSLSQGLASYEAEFDHLAELNGHLADKVVQQHVAEPA